MKHEENVMVAEVAARLKAVRLQNNLSQRALARQAGVTNATISLIESGSMNPSVGALKRVLAGVPMDLGTFFTFELDRNDSPFYEISDLVEIGRAGVSYRLVGGNQPEKSLEILHERYQPGADSGRVAISHDGEEGGVVVRGRIEVTVGDAVKVLGPGEAYYFKSRMPHRFRNVGEEECEVVSACTPPSF